MNKKNAMIASIILNVMLLALVFMVKSNATKQAQEFVKPIQEKAKYQIGQVKDITDNNNLLWSLVDTTWKSPDKSKAFVKKLADSQKLPRCSGKACTGDDARLKTSVTNTAQERSITVGWGSGRGGYKYWFKVLYDAKDKFVTIDVNDLLGKSVDTGAEEAEGEEASQ
ncbi:MAG: hypothetical protein LBC87_05710 [Fibromonadaceae bacterium]|jgi:hypothetical protein|nr:hypothetical protein [Fibromonadaceae bacterium]